MTAMGCRTDFCSFVAIFGEKRGGRWKRRLAFSCVCFLLYVGDGFAHAAREALGGPGIEGGGSRREG